MASMRAPLRWLTRNSFGIWVTITALGLIRSTVDGFVGSSVLEVDQRTEGKKALLDEGLILHQKGDLEGATRAYTRLLEVRQLWLVLLRYPLPSVPSLKATEEIGALVRIACCLLEIPSIF